MGQTPQSQEPNDPLEEAIASAGSHPDAAGWEEADIEALKPRQQEGPAEEPGTNADQVSESEKESLQDELEQLLGSLTEREKDQEDSSEQPGGDSEGDQPPQYMDPQLALELEGPAPPPWLGTRWREIGPEDQREAWIGLRRWVDWLVDEYQLSKRVVPACWYRHSEIVAELYAGMNMEYKTFEEGAPSVNPLMMWQPHLNAMSSRLRGIVENLGGCADGEHQEPERRALNYDEDLWRSTVYSHRESREVDRPDSTSRPWYIRARVEDAKGTPLAESNIGGIAAVQGPGEPSARLTGEKTPGTGTTTMWLEASHVPEGTQVRWEKASSPDGPWSALAETNEADTSRDHQ